MRKRIKKSKIDTSCAMNKKDLMDMIDRQGGVCPLTGQCLSPGNASIDHIIPLGIGGRHALDNMRIVSWQANRARGMLSDQEFVLLCYQVVQHSLNKVGK